MSAPQPREEWREDFPVLFMSDHAANPEADRYFAAMTPDRDKRGRERQFSRDARSIPQVARALDEAKQRAPKYREGMPWPVEYANIGRRRLPMPESPSIVKTYSQEQLRTEAYRHAVDRDRAEECAEEPPKGCGYAEGPEGRRADPLPGRDALLGFFHSYAASVDVAEAGGTAVKTVILQSVATGDREFLVPHGWTQNRVAMFAVRKHRIPDCALCGQRGRIARPLAVGCGGVLRVFGVCFDCDSDIMRDHPEAWLDWSDPGDDWYAVTGWPDERWW